MNLRIVLACLLLIALGLFTAGRAMEEQQKNEAGSSESVQNQTSWTTSDFSEWDAQIQLLVHREDVEWLDNDPWYEPSGSDIECCPAVPPLCAPNPQNATVQDLPEMFI